MASRSDETDKSHFSRLIYRAQEEMDQARMLFFQQRANNAVSEQTRSYLQAALMRYYSIMRRYRDEEPVEEDWPAEQFAQLQEHVLSDQPVPSASAGRGSRTAVETQPGRVEPRMAVELSYLLDDIATELGFAAEASESTHRTKIDDELIEGVEEWRKQKLED